MAAYHYKPLDTSTPTIRLLILRAGPWQSPIQCELQEKALLDKPSYEALSYFWGVPINLKPIYLQNCIQHVTPNLETALRHLRSEQGDRVLWIDALCINQEDLQERTSQVEMMCSIYQAATRVVAWTGEATDDSDMAIKMIREFGSFSQKLWNGEYDDIIADIDGADAGFQTRSQVLEMFGVPTSTQTWNALWKFFDRPYWERVWIIQELCADGVLDNNRGIIMCGKELVERIYYDYTCTTIIAIISSSDHYEGDSFTMNEPVRSLVLRGRHPAGLTMFQTICGCQKNEIRGLAFLIKATKRFKATDSRDKIYALLGLAPGRHRDFGVVYGKSKPFVNVLMDLVEFIIAKDNNLNILLGNRSLQERVGASWLPELTSHGVYDGWIPGHLQLQASGNLTPDVSFDFSSANAAILRARGIVVGTIQVVIEGPRPPTMELANTTTTIELLSANGGVDFMTWLISFSQSLTSDREMETLWRTLVLDHDCSDFDLEYPAPVKFGTMFETSFSQVSLTGSEPLGTQELLSKHEFATPFLRTMTTCVTGRCFFTTVNGCMGLGPLCAKPGDVVVMLYGGDFLFVLRGEGERFELIGDAYIHGAMHGELVKDPNLQSSRMFEIE